MFMELAVMLGDGVAAVVGDGDGHHGASEQAGIAAPADTDAALRTGLARVSARQVEIADHTTATTTSGIFSLRSPR